MEIIGRTAERQRLKRLELSQKPEFVAVYGRRRVGKTFLIVEHFSNKFTFTVTGVSGGNMKDQLRAFHSALNKNVQAEIPMPNDWFQAFSYLEERIEHDITLGRKVLFIDEMPWLDTPKSNFISALEHFWNSYASRRNDILLIVCGSAASWITKKLLDNYGGLHNRVTETIIIKPFHLSDCELFYRDRGIVMSRQQIAEVYMILGGIPYYMDAMDKSYGLSQNIDSLLFDNNAKLSNEFERLYHSLFRYADNHIRIAEVLSKSTTGMTRKEISEKGGISDGGGLTKALDEMLACGFLNRSYDYKKKKNGDYYMLVDFFSLFHFKYLKNQRNHNPNFWTNYLAYPAHRTWCGYAFERLCISHIDQIKQKLGILGVITDTFTFRSMREKGGAQIDLLIDRHDDVINLCECKYTNKQYLITSDDIANLENKKEVFLDESGTRKAIHTTMITTYGLVHNEHINNIQAEITLDDLFQAL